MFERQKERGRIVMTRKRVVMESVLFRDIYRLFCIYDQGMVLTQRYGRDLDLSRQYEQTESLPAQALLE